MDLAVIGAGPGGVAAAVEAARRGARVAVIERDRPGGTCLNWGCIPTKTMLATAEIAHRAAAGEPMGLAGPGPGVDWRALSTRRDAVVDRLVQAHHQEFKREGVEYLQAEVSAITIQNSEFRVLGSQGEIAAKSAILATGSSPGALPGMEPDGEWLLNSDHVLSLPEVPASLLIIGGGVIGCEFASLFADLGADVAIVEALPTLLALTDVDAEVVKELARSFKKRKIAQRLGAKVKRLDTGERAVRAHLVGGETVEAERALLSIGRRLNTDGLGLEELGIRRGPRGEVPVDEQMRTPVPGLYAVGDITGQAQLAHLATHQGIVAARHVLGDEDARLDPLACPAVVFTRPCVASVGLSESVARAQGFDVVVGAVHARRLGKAHAAGELDGLAKLVAERATGRLIGAHLFGAGAEDQIAEVALAVRLGLTLRDLADTIHPHPTMSEGVWEAAVAALRA